MLTEGTNTIDFLYKTATIVDAGPNGEVEGSQATVGIQQSGTTNTPYACHKAFLTKLPFAIRFTPQ